MKRNLAKRWLFYVVGLIILALGIALTIKGRLLGLSSWDVLHYGLWQTFGLTIGSWAIITGAVIVLLTAIGMKRWPKIGVYVNMIAIGLFIDIFNWLIPDVYGWGAHILIFTLGLFIMAFGVAFYITPNLGAGPRDTLMLVLVEKFNMKLSMARNVMEFGAAVAGFLLGGPVFIGTVIIILGLGRLIEVFLPLTRKLMVRFLGGEDPEIIKVI
ncbi:MAG TPA: YitT family protein [Candidatus Salinicoccus stercoripullorum]|uniref:YitT family protein n=1 Tax=Candidatus Salinicoccus stercoripullorum TaxID=2838756 RepID=A0A9D1QK35_9STAP|nr:YitT family protein [Candidatus Salinicoccus stercoripullorum]